MALIEIYHVIAADREVASGETIKEGQIVSLNAAGEVVLQNVTNALPYGIAGDTKSSSASSMPGIENGWQNRASDSFDETAASGKMTVYHSGGEFATDQFDASVSSAAVNAPLYGVNGLLNTADTHTTGVVVGRLVKTAGTYPSGVPGVDLNGDQALGGENSNTYVEVKLAI
jgi:hypothetical protein